MKHYITALILAGGLAAAQAHAACNYPVAPGKFPDGNQASKEEMLAAKSQVVQYNKDMETYLTCIQDEYDTKVAAETQATPEQKARLAKLSPQNVKASTLAGEPITAKLTRAPGNQAPIGGLKVVAASGWFAARPSGTENIYKIYAESFKDEGHLEALVSEAQEMVNTALGADR